MASGSPERDAWLTVPNALTLLRLLAIIPFSIWSMHGRDRAALILFVAAGLTDTLDGTIARRLGQTSKIGRLLDPLTDKLFTGAAYVVLSAFRPGLSSIPLWVMYAVLLRDILILAGSLLVYGARRNSGFKPSIYGKLNTFIEIGVVVCFLAAPDVWFVPALLPGCYILLLVSLLVSTADYLRAGLRMMRQPARTG
jgi:cardiolipin synthase (CMP-forming)